MDFVLENVDFLDNMIVLAHDLLVKEAKVKAEPVCKSSDEWNSPQITVSMRHAHMTWTCV